MGPCKPLPLGWWPSPIIWKQWEFRPWHIWVCWFFGVRSFGGLFETTQPPTNDAKTYNMATGCFFVAVGELSDQLTPLKKKCENEWSLLVHQEKLFPSGDKSNQIKSNPTESNQIKIKSESSQLNQNQNNQIKIKWNQLKSHQIKSKWNHIKSKQIEPNQVQGKIKTIYRKARGGGNFPQHNPKEGNVFECLWNIGYLG